ncbi:MAG: hypothetical protein AAGA18_11495 [Verrucomicrobiota bacterium]
MQISSDSLRTYGDAIEASFSSEVDYGQIVKTYSVTDFRAQGKYSPVKIM